MDVETISRDELKAKLDRGDDFRLVMTLAEWAFDEAHIPGSINVTSAAVAAEMLSLEDEIVVYCSDEACVASQIAYRAMREGGYENVRRYAGGLSGWQEAGYPLEGRSAGP
jgi:rhodanese-related sulfurtransferase